MFCGTVALAVACSTAALCPVCFSQICVPDGTVAPGAIGCVAAASLNMSAPSAVTLAAVAGPVAVTVNGPRTDPVPLSVSGVMFTDGGAGGDAGPWAMTAAAIPLTTS